MVKQLIKFGELETDIYSVRIFEDKWLPHTSDITLNYEADLILQ